jgi:hypothetical protein
MDITSCILSDHNRIKLKINKKYKKKISNTWKLNNSLFNYQWIIEKTEGRGIKIKTFPRFK